MASPKESLEALHTVIATKLTESIEKMDVGEKGLAALLNVVRQFVSSSVRQFVKDSGVEAVPVPGSATGALVGKFTELPYDPAGMH